MKVTFTCEKCGADLHQMYQQTEDTLRRWFTGVNGDIELPDCPNCAKLTYGPLTEEMVAEALELAASGADEPDDFGPEARFVLRLLHKVAEGWCGSEEELTQYWGDTREWLLDLAGKS